jgi:class 3 adenylate cyclase
VKFPPPASYTPKHLAEKILTSKSALEGERKLVTVLFADLKGSMELLADRDPEEARKLLLGRVRKLDARVRGARSSDQARPLPDRAAPFLRNGRVDRRRQ